MTTAKVLMLCASICASKCFFKMKNIRMPFLNEVAKLEDASSWGSDVIVL